MKRFGRAAVVLLILATCCSNALAAQDKVVNDEDLFNIGIITDEVSLREDAVTFCYELTEPYDYYSYEVIIDYLGDTWVLDGYQLASLTITDLTIEVYENTGAPYSNWASELFIGVWMSAWVLNGGYPFGDVDDGPGVYGPRTVTFDLLGDEAITSADFDCGFGATTAWNDGTGLPAGTLLNGTICADFITVTPVEERSWSAVKSLY
ncbi:MAG: hypothetical protein GY835_16160 [bacterium]|nr:hypothetical protein [bacterium]